MKIAVIDDHFIIAQMLSKNLHAVYLPEQINTFASGDLFLRFLNDAPQENLPDLVITDLAMPGISGKDLITSVTECLKKREAFKCKLIVLSSLSDGTVIKSIMEAGANAYLSKDVSFEEMKEAADKVLSGINYISPSLQGGLANAAESNNNLPSLSAREKDLLLQVCDGKTIPEAANVLNISVNTAKSYYKNIMRKFNTHRTSELVVLAIRRAIYIP